MDFKTETNGESAGNITFKYGKLEAEPQLVAGEDIGTGDRTVSHPMSRIVYMMNKNLELCELVIHERWREIPGYEGFYWVSNFGRVQTDKTKGCRPDEAILSPLKHKAGSWRDGRPKVRNYYRLYDSAGYRQDISGAHLVLTAFGQPRPKGKVACHWNDDPSDDFVGNLRWDTQANNLRDIVFTSRNDVRTLEHDFRAGVVGEPILKP